MWYILTSLNLKIYDILNFLVHPLVFLILFSLNFFMVFSFLNIGATCTAWLGSGKGLLSVEPARDADQIPLAENRARFGTDLFGSVSYTFQHGKFRELYNDLTRVDARLDISSANDLAKKVSSLFKNGQDNQSPNELSSPKLNIILQQQVLTSLF